MNLFNKDQFVEEDAQVFDELVNAEADNYSPAIENGQAFLKSYHFDVEPTGVFDEKTQAALSAFLDFQIKWNKITLATFEQELLAEHPKPMLPRVIKCGLNCHDIPMEINGKYDDIAKDGLKAYAEAEGVEGFIPTVLRMFKGE